MTSTLDTAATSTAPPGRSRERLRTVALVAGAVPIALLLLLIVAWAVDAATSTGDVRRNVSLAGHDIGGKDRGELAPILQAVADEVKSTKVHFDLPGTELASTADELGLQLDATATTEAALDLGRHRALPLRPFLWAASFFRHRPAPLHFEVDDTKLTSTLTTLDQQIRTDPTEPTIVYRDAALEVAPGRAGEGLDPDRVADKLRRVTDVSEGVVTLGVKLRPVPPRHGDQEAQAIADEAMAATETPPQGVLAGEARPFNGDQLRRLAGTTEGPDGRLQLTLDAAGTMDILRGMFEGVGTPASDASARVEGGRVVVEGGAPGTGCCDPASVGAVIEALRTRAPSVDVQLQAIQPQRGADYFAKLGLVEKVAEFTTNHAAGQPRVTNIHRMADIVRGAIIEPGGSFSVNDYVGPRTTAKGFVPAPIIGENGYFADDVGGGVSQFATTLFNAAFFAGLDIPAYQAHGIYISRYPYGREATLDYGNIDLRIRNNTPYGILIWPTYSDTSITVALYSTRSIEAIQDSQSQTPYGAVCTSVTTVRKRTWISTGEVQYDKFYALYTPGEGVECDGSTLPDPYAPPTTAPTSAPAPAPPATTAGPAPNPTPAAPATTGAAPSSAAGSGTPTRS